MKRYRYSDANWEERKKIYLEGLDKRKPKERLAYSAGALSVFLLLSFVGTTSYIAYPFLKMVDKYKNNIGTRSVPKRDFINKRVISYKDNCENWIYGF